LEKKPAEAVPQTMILWGGQADGGGKEEKKRRNNPCSIPDSNMGYRGER